MHLFSPAGGVVEKLMVRIDVIGMRGEAAGGTEGVGYSHLKINRTPSPSIPSDRPRRDEEIEHHFANASGYNSIAIPSYWECNDR